jgi:hypothetical protein
MANAIVTAADAHRLLRYEPETGHLYWKPRPKTPGNNRADPSKPAGSLGANGYVMLNVGGKLHRAHRVIWLMVHGTWPTDTIDHVNRNRADNRLANLRAATRIENQQNHPTRVDNKSGHRGVFWHQEARKWWVYINHNRKRKTVGYFPDFEDAVTARKLAEAELFTHA